ncbi:hypothetical protein PMAYCL1PPCAC_02708 [Pristionchus mayeri]|uniref:Uncharacterized protein n=1 Tax=Pristionchus mayeri TaxID=1317129 RepID=A0AAN4Z1W1_9BILA|nr:hypothetical protein PMAYCL1PPCAC_02708 [Pristionchus mayeri]
MDAKSVLRPKVIIPAVIVIVVIIVVALVAVFFLRNPTAADDLLSTMGGTTTEAPEYHTTGPGIQSSYDNSESSPRSFPSASSSSSTTASSHDHTIHSLSTKSLETTTVPPSLRRR